eukprot:scaffold91476_cov15-Tisochrysis_lutea.AAC.1
MADTTAFPEFNCIWIHATNRDQLKAHFKTSTALSSAFQLTRPRAPRCKRASISTCQKKARTSYF